MKGIAEASAVLAAFVLVMMAPASVRAIPPDGFVDEEVAVLRMRGKALGFNFAPRSDGGHMILVCGKDGQLFVMPDPDNSSESEMILDLSDRMCTENSRGFYSVVPHPEFLSNRYIYLFYTFNKYDTCRESPVDGPVNRVSRFVMPTDNSVDVESEEVLLDTPSLLRGIHHGGDMAFGNDGYLYITTGDGGDRLDTTPSQDLSNILGSILRITDDGTIPPDNPFTADKGYSSARCNDNGVAPASVSVPSAEPVHCEEVFAYGLRNPYRFGFDPNAPGTRAFISDVGSAVWEEVHEMNLQQAGANYGWPEREGPCPFGRTENCGESNFTEPIHWYRHSDEGGAAVGLAFVPNGIWPSEYDDSVLFGDYVFGRIYHLTESPSTLCRTCDPPTSGWENKTFHEAEKVIQLTFGPFRGTQALYYLTRGSGGSHIRRIYYSYGGNRPPNAAIASNTTFGLRVVYVSFDGSSSSDPDGDEIDYQWDLGDGSEIVIGPSKVNHTYTVPGVSRVSLTVSDPFGLSETVHIDITVGIPPLVEMESPEEGTEFAVGDQITLSGYAIDRKLQRLPANSLVWEVRQHHNTHFHPFLDPTPGNNILVADAPPPEDFLAANNSHLEIILTAIDGEGVKESVSRIVMPKKVSLKFDSEPSGLDLVLDGYTVTTPIEVVSWENHQLGVHAPDQPPFYWLSWSNNEGQNHTILVPSLVESEAPRFVATFAMGTAPTAPETDQPTPPSVTTEGPAPSPSVPAPSSGEEDLLTPGTQTYTSGWTPASTRAFCVVIVVAAALLL